MSAKRANVCDPRPGTSRTEYDFYTAVTFLLIGLGGGLLLHSLLTPHFRPGAGSSRREL
jgi:hypothetical protein